MPSLSLEEEISIKEQSVFPDEKKEQVCVCVFFLGPFFLSSLQRYLILLISTDWFIEVTVRNDDDEGPVKGRKGRGIGTIKFSEPVRSQGKHAFEDGLTPVD